jgi:hypothetical protein
MASTQVNPAGGPIRVVVAGAGIAAEAVGGGGG